MSLFMSPPVNLDKFQMRHGFPETLGVMICESSKGAAKPRRTGGEPRVIPNKLRSRDTLLKTDMEFDFLYFVSPGKVES